MDYLDFLKDLPGKTIKSQTLREEVAIEEDGSCGDLLELEFTDGTKLNILGRGVGCDQYGEMAWGCLVITETKE